MFNAKATVQRIGSLVNQEFGFHLLDSDPSLSSRILDDDSIGAQIRSWGRE